MAREKRRSLRFPSFCDALYWSHLCIGPAPWAYSSCCTWWRSILRGLIQSLNHTGSPLQAWNYDSQPSSLPRLQSHLSLTQIFNQVCCGRPDLTCWSSEFEAGRRATMSNSEAHSWNSPDCLSWRYVQKLTCLPQAISRAISLQVCQRKSFLWFQAC